MTEYKSEGSILVIDDEPGIRQGCRRALEPLGYRVETASTLQDGLDKFKASSFDLILLDVMMPDGRGVDVLEPMITADPDLVAIIITGYATVELAVEAIKQGAYDFISKAFTADVLRLTVSQGLEKRLLSKEQKRVAQLEQDRAQLQQEKEEMERMDRFKTEFTTMVAHELRAPTTALQSFLLSMLKGYVPEEKQQEILTRAVQRAQELLDLINDLLDLAAARQRLTEGKHTLHALSDSLGQVVDLFRPQAEEKGIQLDVQDQTPPAVLADPDQMVQVWTNLLSNAIKYTPENGQVSVRLEQADNWAVGCVQDTGIGIKAEYLEQVFEDFYRTPEAKAFNHLGTGLGLTLVKRILEIHGGEIRVDSTPGEGSTFTFKLPLAME